MKKKNLYNVVFIIGLAFFSCFNSYTKKEDPIPFEAIGDVYYISKIINNERNWALAYYAYANDAISSAIVTVPNGGTFSLDESLNGGFTMYLEPNQNEFSTNSPSEGNYIFDLRSNAGDKLQSVDNLKRENLEIPEIQNIRFEDLDSSYDIEWSLISKANAFSLKLIDSDGTEVFISEEIDGSSTAFTFILNDLGEWKKQIELGNTYTIQIIAYAYENTANATAAEGSVNSQAFNIQEISIGESEFVWDEQ